ncbi:MAG: hypothetical protein H6841_07770 [Planctomycetes bacterium]|nr:hypothetical protein [Planctomycetota bacterium]MCB9935508.1 hypothetical protein [Planctomycetota bacterium]
MNRFIWAFAAGALALAAVVGFTILTPTAERTNNPKPAERSEAHQKPAAKAEAEPTN